MMVAIEKYLVPLGVSLPQTSRDIVGGYFIWLSLPDTLEAEDVAGYAKQHENLIIAPGKIFGVYGDEKAVDLRAKVRVCFSWVEETKLAEGIERLGQVIDRMQRNNGQSVTRMGPPSGQSSSLLEKYR